MIDQSVTISLLLAVALLATQVHMDPFPFLLVYRLQNEYCMELPGVAYLVIGAVSVLLFITLAGFNKMAQMDLNPATIEMDAYAHPGQVTLILHDPYSKTNLFHCHSY